MNQVTITGNVVRDAECKYFDGGGSVVNFTIAVNEKWVDAKGTAREKVAFVPCKAFGKAGRNAATYKKGQFVIAVGKLEQENWEKDGVKHSKLVLNAFLSYALASAQADSQEQATSGATDDPAF